MEVNILGCRGLPPSHGGFETLAFVLSTYLVKRGWSVNVYCQDDDAAFADGAQDEWNGITRTHFQPRFAGPLGTMYFDLKSVRHALGMPGIDLVLGYNTAVFSLLQRLSGRRTVMNMDGIEWMRSKWGPLPKAWFFLNELIGANVANAIIADHPEMERHFRFRCLKSPRVIAYGGDVIERADPSLIEPLGLTPDKYLISIARIEPENSILELVQSANAMPEGFKMVVLGNLDDTNSYHQRLRAAASDQVIFPGGIYDPTTVSALRFFARAYLHGHQVGGTNPSLVEALGAGNAVIAHDNPFNRWTAGDGQLFFSDQGGIRSAIDRFCSDDALTALARNAARARHARAFRWDDVLSAYEGLLAEEYQKIRVPGIKYGLQTRL
ncbi:MAG: DUF1972 domain-containing protein [Pseudomonadota bacterium]